MRLSTKAARKVKRILDKTEGDTLKRVASEVHDELEFPGDVPAPHNVDDTRNFVLADMARQLLEI
jgi:hypothetical protein